MCRPTGASFLDSLSPHFIAGFSGGYKGVFPGVADNRFDHHYIAPMSSGHPRSQWEC